MSAVPVAMQPKSSLVTKFASKFSIEPGKLLTTLKSTAFRQREGSAEVTDEQMAALLIVADQYGLNPFTREIYAFPDKGGIVPVVGVDGWSRIINEHPQSDGFEFHESEETVKCGGKDVPKWMEVIIYRKDRAHAIRVREQFAEVVRENMPPWKSHPSRMLRHKVLIQGARVAYGFTGIYDEDEAERIVERDMGQVQEVRQERAVLPAYPQESFTENLPKWRHLIAAGKQTADDIISMITTKGTLTVEQIAAIRQPEKKAEPPKTQYVAPAMLAALRKKAEGAAISDEDIRTFLSIDSLDNMTVAQAEAAIAFIDNPTGDQ